MERQGDCPHDYAFVEMMAGPGEADIQLFIRETEEKLRLNSCSIEKSLQELQAKIGESWAGDKGPSPTECLQRFSQRNLSELKPISTDHQELLDFLKALQHLLKTEQAHEESVIHLLLNISSQSGVAFPSSSSSSDRSQASMAPFCSVHDDLALTVQETWDDIRHLLGRYLLDKLSMERAAVPLRIHLLQQLCFLYPETEVLEKYRALQSKAVLELLRKTQLSCQGGEQGFGKLSQIFQTVGPGFCAMFCEDMHVLNGIYEPRCVLDFLSQAYLSTLVKELEVLMETEVEVVLKDNTTSGRKSWRSSGKKAAVAPQEDPNHGRNFYLTSHQLNCLAQLASTLLELERRVEDLSAELGFLNCAGESTPVLRGGITKGGEETDVLESKATPDLLLQTTEVACLQFEWRAAFRTFVPQMTHCVKVVLEDIYNKSLQQEESTHSSSSALIPLVPVSQNHGAELICSERDTPKMVAKFCGDVIEKLDNLLPLAVACKDDVLLPVRSCYVEVCGRVSSALLTRLDERAREVPQASPYKNLPTLLASSTYIHHRLAYFESQLQDGSSRPLTLLPIRRSQEVTEAIHEHLTSYCVHVCASSLLQDAESHHWADDKPFYEGERCSFSVQMWHYFLSALRSDLWDTVHPALAQQILAQVLAQTLELSVQRYSRAQPSSKRLAQIRVDITAVLLCVEQLLWSVCGGVEELIRPELASGTWVSIIHSLCNQLMSVLVILTAPLPELYRTFQSDGSFGLAEASSSHAPFWLSNINPTVFPLDLLREGVESEASTLWLLNLVSSAPGFSSALVLQAALHSDSLLLRLLLSQSHLCMCSEVEVSPEVEKAGAEFVEAIFSILSSLNNFPRALAQVFEDYVERRQLWDLFYSLADSTKEDPVLFKCVRAVLFKPIRTLIGHLVSMMQACEELPVPLFRQEILECVQAKIPKEWNYTPQEARSKDTSKSTISLTIQALSFIFTHLPSSVASLPLSVRFFFHTAEKHLCQRARQLRPTGLLIYALLCCLCQGLEDGETLEQVSAEPLERGVKERLALLSECLRVNLGQEKSVPKPTVHKILQGLEEKRPKWSAMQLQKALKLCNESAFERVESNLVQERGVPSEPAEQKMGTALLALCQLAGGIQNLQQIHHTIQLNEGLLRSRLSSDVNGSLSPEGQQSVLFWSAENKMRSPGRFNPLFHFDHIGHAELDQTAMSEREWDWARLLLSYQGLSQVTFRHLLANRWEMQDGAALEEEEQILVERLKKTYFSPALERPLE